MEFIYKEQKRKFPCKQLQNQLDTSFAISQEFCRTELFKYVIEPCKCHFPDFEPVTLEALEAMSAPSMAPTAEAVGAGEEGSSGSGGSGGTGGGGGGGNSSSSRQTALVFSTILVAAGSLLSF